MPSSYTSSLRLTLPATGELTGTWGTTVNTGITELLDSAVAGTASISTWGGAGVAYTLSNTDGAADEARKMFIVATGAPGEAKNVICPAVSKLYFFRNDTTGGFALTLKTSGGSGIAVPAGQYRVLYCNGTNVVEAFNALSSLTLGTALAVTSGGTGTTTSTGTGSVVLSNSPALTTPNLGIPSAATLTNATGLPLTTGVTGTLAASNGGTGQSAYTTGDLIYATGATALAKLGIGSSTNVLTSSGSAPQWTAASSVAIGTATNIAGGTGGSVPYQSGAATTTFLGIGAANTVMTSSGSAPQWSTALTGLTGVSTTTATLSSDLTLTGGTANGVLYLNASKVATSGSGFNTDGTNISIGATANASQRVYARTATDTGTAYYADNGVNTGFTVRFSPSTTLIGNDFNNPLVFLTNNTEQMRLTSTGLGIGTSSPAYKLDVVGTAAISGAVTLSGGTANGVLYLNGSKVATSGSALTFDGSQLTMTASNTYKVLVTAQGSDGIRFVGLNNAGNAYASAFIDGSYVGFNISGSEQMRLTSTGLGIGTSSPGTSLQVGNSSGLRQISIFGGGYDLTLGASGGTIFGVASQAISTVFNTAAVPLGIGTNASQPLIFGTTGIERMRLDASGNLGLGVTPSVYNIGRAVEVGAVGNALWSTSNDVYLTANTFYQSGYKYADSTFASIYEQTSGAHKWFTAPSGTAGAAISFTQAMTLDASGNLGVGVLPIANTRIYVRTAATTDAAFYADNSLNSGFVVKFAPNLTSIGNDFNQPLAFLTNNTERARIDSSGNLGLGVTPSAWAAPFGSGVFEHNAGFIAGSSANNVVRYGLNSYYNGTNYIYKANGLASALVQNSSSFQFFTAPSGTAGDPISFTQAMTLDASGQLSVGTTAVNTAGSGYQAFTINGANGSNIALNGGATNIGLIYAATGNSSLYVTNQTASGPLIFGAGSGSERARITSAGDLITNVNGTAPSLSTNSTMSFELTSNTSLKIVVRGTDGVTRSVSLTLA